MLIIKQNAFAVVCMHQQYTFLSLDFTHLSGKFCNKFNKSMDKNHQS